MPQGLFPSLSSPGEKKKKKLLQALPGSALCSGLGSRCGIQFPSHSPELLNLLARCNQKECISAEEVWGCYQMGNSGPHFAYSLGFASSPQTAPFYHQHFLANENSRYLGAVVRSMFASVYCWSSPAMEVALTITPLITCS